MPLQIERQLLIQALIKEYQTVKVDELARRLNVSSNTIRRDLSLLEKQGVLKRTQGGAMAQDLQPATRQSFDLRSRTNVLEKEIIGKCAAKLVKSGSTIILDAGTTTQQLANNLRHLENLTIATNSLEIAYSLMTNPNITVILSGGIVIGASRSLTGLPAENFFTHIHADQIFLATCGISLERGLTNRNMHEIPVKQKMIEVAREVILLADHDKFDKVALSSFAPLSCVHKIVTDAKAPKHMIAELESLGIQVVIAYE